MTCLLFTAPTLLLVRMPLRTNVAVEAYARIIAGYHPRLRVERRGELYRIEDRTDLRRRLFAFGHEDRANHQGQWIGRTAVRGIGQRSTPEFPLRSYSPTNLSRQAVSGVSRR